MADSELIDEVYGCELCPGALFGFARRPNGNGFYKFPPTIGARGEAPLLFIGINPRMTTNMRLHKELAEHRASFEILAGNHVPTTASPAVRAMSRREARRSTTGHTRGSSPERSATRPCSRITPLSPSCSCARALTRSCCHGTDRVRIVTSGDVVAHVKPG